MQTRSCPRRVRLLLVWCTSYCNTTVWFINLTGDLQTWRYVSYYPLLISFPFYRNFKENYIVENVQILNRLTLDTARLTAQRFLSVIYQSVLVWVWKGGFWTLYWLRFVELIQYAYSRERLRDQNWITSIEIYCDIMISERCKHPCQFSRRLWLISSLKAYSPSLLKNILHRFLSKQVFKHTLGGNLRSQPLVYPLLAHTLKELQ